MRSISLAECVTIGFRWPTNTWLSTVLVASCWQSSSNTLIWGCRELRSFPAHAGRVNADVLLSPMNKFIVGPLFLFTISQSLLPVIRRHQRRTFSVLRR